MSFLNAEIDKKTKLISVTVCCYSIIYTNKTFFFEEYENKITKIFKILDADKSGTIQMKELETIYPDAAKSLFTRFDIDHDGDLGIEELKQLINTTQLADEVLDELKKNVTFLFECYKDCVLKMTNFYKS